MRSPGQQLRASGIGRHGEALAFVQLAFHQPPPLRIGEPHPHRTPCREHHRAGLGLGAGRDGRAGLPGLAQRALALVLLHLLQQAGQFGSRGEQGAHEEEPARQQQQHRRQRQPAEPGGGDARRVARLEPRGALLLGPVRGNLVQHRGRHIILVDTQ